MTPKVQNARRIVIGFDFDRTVVFKRNADKIARVLVNPKPTSKLGKAIIKAAVIKLQKCRRGTCCITIPDRNEGPRLMEVKIGRGGRILSISPIRNEGVGPGAID